MKRILMVVGTRPEAIKMCPLYLELKKSKQFDTSMCATGQHKEICDEVFAFFNIEPDYRLSVLKPGQSLTDLTISLLNGINTILDKERFDLVLVHGDTCSAFSGALAAFYKKIDVGHVEAGLRTNKIYSPYPEEVFRCCIDSISKYLFSPTVYSSNNFSNHFLGDRKCFVTGNTVIDALKYTVDSNFDIPENDWIGKRKLILLTTHRRENWGDGFDNIFKAINILTEVFKDICFLYPMHPNPAIRAKAHSYFDKNESVRLIEPLSLIKFHNYLNNCYLIMTDSGGIQEEASALKKPVLVLRDTTERPEGIIAGTLVLSGTRTEDIVSCASHVLTNDKVYLDMCNAKNPYGDGNASKKIKDILENCMND